MSQFSWKYFRRQNKETQEKIILEALNKSGVFGKSARQYELFKYLLSKSLNDEIDSIGEYHIAVDILQRPSDFDPTCDSIVRAEMKRLRTRLTLFSKGNQQLQLSIPAGQYEVIIERPETSEPAPRRGAAYFSFIGLAVILLTNVFTKIGSEKSPKTARESGIQIVDYASNNSCSLFYPNLILAKDTSQPSEPELEQLLQATILDVVEQSHVVNIIDSSEKCDEEIPEYILLFRLYQFESENFLELKARNSSSQTILEQKRIQLNENTSGYDLGIAKLVNQFVLEDGVFINNLLGLEEVHPITKKNIALIKARQNLYGVQSDEKYLEVYSEIEELVERGQASPALRNALGSYIKYINSHESRLPALTPANWTEAYGQELRDEARSDFPSDKSLFLSDMKLIRPGKVSSSQLLKIEQWQSQFNYNPAFTEEFAKIYTYVIVDKEKALKFAARTDALWTHVPISPEIKYVHALISEEDDPLFKKCVSDYEIRPPYYRWQSFLYWACSIRAEDQESLLKARKHMAEVGLGTKQEIMGFVNKSYFTYNFIDLIDQFFEREAELLSISTKN